MYEQLMAAIHHNDDEPWPGDEELSGARGAHGWLVQWTADDGTVVTEPQDRAPSRHDLWNDNEAVKHIGQPCICLYAIRSDRSALAYVRFADGVRTYVYTSDCRFD